MYNDIYIIHIYKIRRRAAPGPCSWRGPRIVAPTGKVIPAFNRSGAHPENAPEITCCRFSKNTNPINSVTKLKLYKGDLIKNYYN